MLRFAYNIYNQTMYKMDQLSKRKLYVITFSLDGPLLYGLNTLSFSMFDQFWVSMVLGCHLLFVYALYSNDYRLIDILHYFVAILPFLSIATTHILLKIMSCSLLVLMQILWIKEKGTFPTTRKLTGFRSTQSSIVLPLFCIRCRSKGIRFFVLF
jgi:hypothetical protein